MNYNHKDKTEEGDIMYEISRLPKDDITEYIHINDVAFRMASSNNNKDDRFWYLATPYSKYESLEDAFDKAVQMTAFLIDNGIPIYSPIVHTHHVSNYTKLDGTDSDVWFNIEKPFIRISKGIIVCTMKGWEESKGIAREVKLALELNLPIVYTEFLTLPKL